MTLPQSRGVGGRAVYYFSGVAPAGHLLYHRNLRGALTRQVFSRSCPIPGYGREISVQDNAHRTLRHELCHLHGVPAGEEPLRGVLCTRSAVQYQLHNLILRSGEREIPPYLR